jgi:hypothetical protein
MTTQGNSRTTTWIRLFLRLCFFGGLFAAAAAAGSLCFFQFATPEQNCLSCHEIQEPYDRWAVSTHREVSCKECHGGTIGAFRENVGRLVGHVRNKFHDNMGLSEQQVEAMTAVCKGCHAQEYAQWHAGGHAVGYADIFLDEKHNATEQLAADCLRCHGMFFRGSVGDMVEPLDIKGPWRLKQPALAGHAVIPCLACHQVHVAGHPYSADADSAAGVRRNPASLYSRNERSYFAAADLPVPKIHDHGRPVAVSPDPRQRLCVECHAPDASGRAGSGDDRTPLGVHEGISCAACHAAHSNETRASCAVCHPQFSHCGLDVETMDTTFHSLQSRHNIHTVRCTDCHKEGVPKKAAGKGKNISPLPPAEPSHG